MSAPPALNHLYLVHDEDNAANLTPALDPHFAPRRVALAFDPSRAALAEAMAGVLRGYGLRVDLWRLDDDTTRRGRARASPPTSTPRGRGRRAWGRRARALRGRSTSRGGAGPCARRRRCCSATAGCPSSTPTPSETA